MQRMPRQKQALFEFTSPSGLNELQVELLVRAINFVAYNRVIDRAQVHTNLMRASGAWNCADHTEPSTGGRRSLEAPLNRKFRLRWRTSGMNHLFQPNR